VSTIGKEIELDWLAKWNLYSPRATAIVDYENDRSFSYEDFYRISNGLIPFLTTQNIQVGDRVAIMDNNKVETIFLFFALQRMGAVLVPINFRFSKEETEFVLNDSGAKLFFYGDDYKTIADQIDIKKINSHELAKEVISAKSSTVEFSFKGEYDQPCKILYTSGTTGFPKGVVITPKILFWNSINTNLSLNISSQDCMVSFLPLFHTGGWNVLLTPFIHHGAKTIFLSKFDSQTILNVCEQQRVSVLFGVPTTLAMLSKDPLFEKVELGSVRFAIVGGEAMPLKLIETWHRRGVAIRQGFGLTECGPNCFSLSESDAEEKIGSVGRPNFYVQTRIINEDNQDVGVNEVGELLLKGPMCMTHYWKNEDATKSSFYEGWLRTGDLVKRDEQNYFYIVGRKKEMYISGGENIYPAEVERVLNSHPQIDEVAVIGVKDEKWGEVGKAFISFKSNIHISEDELIKFCEAKLARFKIPKHFEFLGELPKGSTGKILKRHLATTKENS
jgi:fatty-acyl-CoA synthase